MRKTVVLVGAIIMALALCSCKPAVAKKAVKITREYLENHPKTIKGVGGAVRGAERHIHRCKRCNNGKVYSYGCWINCNQCGGKGWLVY